MDNLVFDSTLKSDRLREVLRRLIAEGGLEVGDQFPSEPELIARYKVSRSTVREAIAALAQEGLLYRAQGKGTFVAERKPVRLTIGVVLPFLFFSEQTPFGAGTDVMPRLMQAIEGAARRMGANILLCLDNNLPALERANLEGMLARGVDAVLLNPIACEENRDAIAGVRAAGLPLVFVDTHPESADGSDDGAEFVVTDNEAGAYRATQSLIAREYRRVVYVTSPAENSSLRDRRRGYERAMREAGLPADVRFVEAREMDAVGADRISEEERGYRLAMDALLTESVEPFAVFAAEAPILAGVWRAVEEREMRVEARIAFACFDEPFIRFPASVFALKVLQPFAEIGQCCVAILQERVAQKGGMPDAPQRVYLAPEIVASKV